MNNHCSYGHQNHAASSTTYNHSCLMCPAESSPIMFRTLPQTCKNNPSLLDKGTDYQFIIHVSVDSK